MITKTASRRKVWIVNHYALTEDQPGSSRHLSLAQELVEKNMEVWIFASNVHYNNYQTIRKVETSSNYSVEKIGDHIHFVWIRTISYSKNNWKRYLNIFSFVRRVNLDKKAKDLGLPDVIIGSSFHLFSPWIAMKFAKRHKIPFIAEIRDLWPETLIQLGKSKWHPLVMLLAFMEQKIYLHADKIILLFPNAHKYVMSLNLNIDRNKMVWIPNGVNVQKFKCNRRNEPIVPKDESSFNILNAGSIGNVYALDYLLDAAKILQDKGENINIHLVGDGPRKKDLIDQSKELGLNNLFFHDPVSKSKMPELLQEYDILYSSTMNSPLYKWGMSLNKVNEYLAASKPIVFAINSTNNPVEEAKAGCTIQSDRPEEIAQTFIQLKNLPEKELKEFGERGRKYAAQNLDFSILGKRLQDTIEVVLKNTLNDSLIGSAHGGK